MSKIILLAIYIFFAIMSIKAVFKPKKTTFAELEKNTKAAGEKLNPGHIGCLGYVLCTAFSLMDIWGGLTVGTPWSMIGAAIVILLNFRGCSKLTKSINDRRETLYWNPFFIRVYNAAFDSYILVMLILMVLEGGPR